MLTVEVVQVEDAETGVAMETAIRRLRLKLDGKTPQAGIVLAGIDSDHERILQNLREAFPTVQLVGCTTSGELSSDLGFSDDSISLMFICSDALSISAGIGVGLSSDPGQATARALSMARKGMCRDERLCLVFPDGLHDAPEEILKILNDQVGPNCRVFGGLAARHWQSDIPPRQFFGDRVYEDALALLLIGGPVRHDFIVCNSWEPVGSRAPVTHADGHELLRIGKQSALDFYRYYLGPHTSPALEFPLAVFEEGNGAFYIRSPVDYHESSGGVLFSTPIPEGAEVRLTEATRDRLIEDMNLQLEGLAAHSSRFVRPAAGLVFSCATRKQILGTWTPMEIESLRQRLPESLPVLGFYSYGEISPIGGGKRSWLHNCTMVTLLLGEEGEAEQPVRAHSRADIQKPVVDRQGAPDDLRRQLKFIQKKLARSEAYRERLELSKDLTTTLLRKINREINAARLEIKRKNDMLARTLTLADEIQHNLLPAGELDSTFFDIAGTSIFCSETGGDYYDVVNGEEENERSLRVVVGDVTGHGIEAALLMTTARALLRGRLSRPGDLAEVIGDVNRQLVHDVKDSGRFVTLLVMNLMPETGVVEWVRAGHDPAIWYDPEVDRFRALRGPGIALGVDSGTTFSKGRREGLRKGQILILGTDGLWETRNEAGELFGKARLLKTVKSCRGQSAGGILSSVMDRLDRFRGLRAPEDDVTLVIVKVKDLTRTV